jgi:putative inorganic carbon (hco3(-)) transporter
MTLFQTLRFISRHRIGQQGIVIVTALMVGLVISHEHWLLLAAIAAMSMVFFRPVHVAVGLFAFAVPFDSIGAAGQGSPTVTRFIGAGATAVLFIIGYVDKRLQRPPRTAQLWIAFLIWSVITSMWAVNPTSSLEGIPTTVSFLILYFVAVSFRIKREEFEPIVLFTILGGLAAAIITLYQYNSGIFFSGTRLARGSLVWGGREANPNVFAIGLLVPLSLEVGWFFHAGRTFVKIAMVALVAITSWAILVTLSRGGLLAMCAVIAVYLYRLRVNWRLATMIAVLAALLMAAAPNVFFARLETADRGAGRLDIWEAGLIAFQHYKVFGAGLDNFPVVYSTYAGYAPHFWGYGRDAHNVFLAVAVEFGSLGLLLFISAISYQLREAARVRAHEREQDYSLIACEAGCWGVLVGGFFGHILWLKAFWLSWILLACAIQLVKRDLPTPLRGRVIPAT